MTGFEIVNSIIKKVYLKFQDSLEGKNIMSSDDFAQQNCFVLLQKYDADTPICKGSPSHLASNEHNFHLCCHWHVLYIKYKFKP